MKNILQIGLKLFLAIAGGGSGNDKSDSSPVQVNIIEFLFLLSSRFKFGDKGRHRIDFTVNLTYINTGCPNKHGNSVTNSISSFQIILWFSIVIPTEKAVWKSFGCYVHILFVYILTAYGCKIRKLQYTDRVNLSVFTVQLAETLWTNIYSLLPFS